MATPRNLGWTMSLNGGHYYKRRATHVYVITRAAMRRILEEHSSLQGARNAVNTIFRAYRNSGAGKGSNMFSEIPPNRFYGTRSGIRIMYAPNVNRNSVQLPSLSGTRPSVPRRVRSPSPKREIKRRRRNNNNNNRGGLAV